MKNLREMILELVIFRGFKTQILLMQNCIGPPEISKKYPPMSQQSARPVTTSRNAVDVWRGSKSSAPPH